ncbi:MAG TPA: tetratricopeptide repeat protein [Vicinamibacterales bacterium]|nr:tetratricopeptide repeat protein [Vicinamibacterales bacterium]
MTPPFIVVRRHATAIVVIAIALMQTGASGQSMTVSLADALNYYEAGEHRMVERALAGAGGGDPKKIVALLQKDGAAWIVADGPDRAARRRLVVATFALEAGYAGLDTQWTVGKEILEWACETFRKAGPPSEAERQWQLAALALFEGSFEPRRGPNQPEASDLLKHVTHIRGRFPNEPRLELVPALLDEWEFWANRHKTVGVGEFRQQVTDNSIAALAIPAIEKAAANAAIRPEAQLRLGYLQYAHGDLDAALKSLAEAAEGDDDPTRVYLAHLFTGWVHEQAGRMPEALASFGRALEAVRGLSAALALGVRLYAVDRRDEADAIVQDTLAAAVTDPYKLYGYGDLRRWPAIVAGLRRSFEVQR